MCGIAGVVGASRIAGGASHVVEQMTARLIHRGPDHGAVWCEPDGSVALGHRRLSIVDLSPEGHQPMSSSSGAFVIVYNGEVYNFIGLRQELEADGHRFRGRSDTEVILAAIERWGVDSAIARFGGMFAFALWNRKSRELILARDRLGKKPLYFGRIGNTVAFASELKALRCVPGFTGEINGQSVAQYLRHNYVPAPHSIYRNVYKLAAGSIARFSVAADCVDTPKITAFWTLKDSAFCTEKYSGSANDAVRDLETLLRDATSSRMVADVPLGAFLSGGVDSSLVVAMMQMSSSIPVKTFTIGFNEKSYNESQHALAVARHLGTDHTEIIVTARDALNVIPKLPTIYDEPFADSSQIPTYLICEATRRSVTVALSGDGGDEAFVESVPMR